KSRTAIWSSHSSKIRGLLLTDRWARGCQLVCSKGSPASGHDEALSATFAVRAESEELIAGPVDRHTVDVVVPPWIDRVVTLDVRTSPCRYFLGPPDQSGEALLCRRIAAVVGKEEFE